MEWQKPSTGWLRIVLYFFIHLLPTPDISPLRSTRLTRIDYSGCQFATTGLLKGEHPRSRWWTDRQWGQMGDRRPCCQQLATLSRTRIKQASYKPGYSKTAGCFVLLSIIFRWCEGICRTMQHHSVELASTDTKCFRLNKSPGSWFCIRLT